MTTQTTYNYIGIDVAKRSIDVHSDAYRGLTKSYLTTGKQLDALAARLAKKDNAFVVCEATGTHVGGRARAMAIDSSRICDPQFRRAALHWSQ